MTGAAIDGILGAIPMPALTIDGAERIAALNAEARALIGPGVVGRNFVTMLRQPALVETIEAVLRDSRPRQTVYLSNDGGQDTTFQVTVRAIQPHRLVLACFADITHVEKAGQMRRDFVANVSHELRTPLTALMGFIETLRGPARDDASARDRFLDIMQAEAERMNRLVSDLLSLARVEDDERVRPRSQVDLTAILNGVVQTLTPLATEAGVTIEADYPPDPVPLTADADQLTQVFTNLTENAIKYASAGKRVTLAIAFSDREPSLRAPGLLVTVRDHGPGIDPVHLPRLTERFYRVDSHRSRDRGGTGLGLAIVKHIVNRHRGRLRVESTPGQGTLFTVVLPR